MKTQNVQYFTDKEEEFVKLLIDVGTKQSIAKVLVFLANTPEATSRDIERGTDLRQPEVSIAMRYLTSQNWIKSRESKGESKGRPLKIYVLAADQRHHEQHREREERGSEKAACSCPEVTGLYPVTSFFFDRLSAPFSHSNRVIYSPLQTMVLRGLTCHPGSDNHVKSSLFRDFVLPERVRERIGKG